MGARRRRRLTIVAVIILFLILPKQSLKKPGTERSGTNGPGLEEPQLKKQRKNGSSLQKQKSELNFTEARGMNPQCCNIVDGQSIQEQENGSCKLTCFTQLSCQEGSTFPYSSEQERKWLTRDTDPQKWKCAPFQREQPNIVHPQWCRLRKPTKHHHRLLNDSSLMFHNGCTFSPYNRMIVFPRHRLAFCGIPKVGITQWLKLLRFSFGAVDYESLPYYKRDHTAFVFSWLPRQRQVEILTDPAWTKAVFLREPAERLLSAFLDKVAKRRNITFADFVYEIDSQPESKCNNLAGPSWCLDPHWRPQFYSCGMHEMLPFYDFVGSMDDAAKHSKALLERVGLWEQYGASYTTIKRKDKKKNGHPCAILPMDPASASPDVYTVFQGFQQDIKAKEDGHTRDSRSKIDLYYDASLREIVQRLYRDDFRLWNALQSKKQWATGQELAEHLNPSQC